MLEKKTRRKPIKSCLECNRRKQKCNRQKPCNHCISRGVEHACVYSNLYQRGRSYPERRSSSTGTEPNRERDTSTTVSSYDSDPNEKGVDALEALGYLTPLETKLKFPAAHYDNLLVDPARSCHPSSPQGSDYQFSAISPMPPGNTSGLSPSLSPAHSLSRMSHPQRIWPERSMADFLTGMFLNEMNRIYEIIHPLAFKTRYESWWITQDNNDFKTAVSSPGDDCDFGLLIIRMCLLSCQCLPHPKYPTHGVLHTHLSELEEWLYATAERIDMARASQPPSTITVQQRFFNVCYLKNYAKIRECWSVLSAAVKDAHEVGLHLKDPGIVVSELDMEYRRRTFWSLYVWDRFMSSFFGHWPLIPEGFFDIDSPHDNLQAYTVSPYVLTPFTSRVFHIKLARYMTAFMSPPSWRSDQLDPIIVADFSQRFQEFIIDQLPPAFWLDNADTTWDAVDPTITGKRSLLHMFIISTRAALYKAFADPCNSLHQPKDGRPNYQGDLVALSHRRSLMKETCGVISAIHKLYMLPPDERSEAGDNLFLFPTFMTEAMTCLGVCLLSIQADRDDLAANGIQIGSDPGLQYSYAAFFKGYSVLCQQAPRYALAKKALRILEEFHRIVRATACNQYPSTLENFAPGTRAEAANVGAVFQLEHALASMYDQGREKVAKTTNLLLPAWLPSFLEAPARSWVFQDRAFFRDLLG